ncbi:hypothetical protein LINPERHAP1_LOCUS16568 [Linum perenne]
MIISHLLVQCNISRMFFGGLRCGQFWLLPLFFVLGGESFWTAAFSCFRVQFFLLILNL